jgi:hypothetical protein
VFVYENSVVSHRFVVESYTETNDTLNGKPLGTGEVFAKPFLPLKCPEAKKVPLGQQPDCFFAVY